MSKIEASLFCVARNKARFAQPIDQELDAGVEVIGIE